MPVTDSEIDRLYQLPLAEFTAARNELAKRAGDRRAEVKALQKPNSAAWAVNQLYWHRRPIFKRLTSAAEKLRAAHARVLGGGKADVSAAERAHAEALHAAEEEIRALLEAAGEKASVAVMNDIRDTLQALPADEPPGRLVRPLAPMGFAALLKMLPGGEAARPALVEAPRTARPSGGRQSAGTVAGASAPAAGDDAASRRQARAEAERAAREARHAEAERKRLRKDLERQIREARAAERERDAAAAAARDALARAEHEERRRQAALEEQKFEVRRLAAELASREQQARAAAEARHALETRLTDL